MTRLRALIRGHRYRTLVVAALVIVGLLVVWEHSGEPEPHGDHLEAFCLAVVSGISAVGVLAAPCAAPGSRMLRPARMPQPITPVVGPVALPAARAGPAALQILRR